VLLRETESIKEKNCSMVDSPEMRVYQKIKKWEEGKISFRFWKKPAVYGWSVVFEAQI